MSSERGVTLVEATIVLAVVSILAAAAAPTASRTLDRAKLTRAQQDTQAIRTAIDDFITQHTAFMPFAVNGQTNTDDVEYLVSDGDIPVTGIGATDWDAPVSVVVGGAGVDVDFLERHLVTNTPGPAAGGHSYNVTTGPWRGAYINAPIDPDPWGNRYAVNVLNLQAPGVTTNDTFVLSAGPDEQIDTSTLMNGARPGDDDIINVIRRDVSMEVP